MTTASTPLAGDDDRVDATAGARETSPLPPLVLGFLLAIAVVIALAGPDRVGGVVSDLFEAYVAAQQKMLEASGNVTADGRVEFAVLLHDAGDAGRFRESVAGMQGVQFEREADLPGWMVVTTEAGNRDGLDALMALPEARLVVPNRGLWICH